MRRSYPLAIVLTFLLSLLVPAATTFAAASITLSQSSGAPGATFTVSGSGFLANTAVHILFGGNGGTEIGTPTADGSGNFSNFSVVVPTSGDVTGGSKTIVVTDNTNSTSTTFLVPFSLTLNPSSGASGTTVQVTGAGFQPGEVVNITWDQGGSQVATPTANGNGGISASFVTPNGVGPHQVVATGQSSHFVLSTTFTANGSSSVGGATLTLNPSSGGAGSFVNLSGTGFNASEQVNVTIDGNGLGTITSDGNGNFTSGVTLPSSLASGGHTIMVTGGSSGHSASAVFTVTSGGQAAACTSTRPGNGFGDDNHCHSGPRGHEDEHGQGNQGNHGKQGNHGHHGDDDDQGDDD